MEVVCVYIGDYCSLVCNGETYAGELAGITIIVGPLVVIVMLIVYLCMSCDMLPPLN